MTPAFYGDLIDAALEKSNPARICELILKLDERQKLALVTALKYLLKLIEVI